MLGHGAFVEDFACEEKAGADFAGVFFGLFEKKYTAVYAGVHVFAVAVFGVAEHA